MFLRRQLHLAAPHDLLSIVYQVLQNKTLTHIYIQTVQLHMLHYDSQHDDHIQTINLAYIWSQGPPLWSNGQSS
jgi:hypothetical protein